MCRAKHVCANQFGISRPIQRLCCACIDKTCRSSKPARNIIGVKIAVKTGARSPGHPTLPRRSNGENSTCEHNTGEICISFDGQIGSDNTGAIRPPDKHRRIKICSIFHSLNIVGPKPRISVGGIVFRLAGGSVPPQVHGDDMKTVL